MFSSFFLASMWEEKGDKNTKQLLSNTYIFQEPKMMQINIWKDS